jgi:hypothetical protein
MERKEGEWFDLSKNQISEFIKICEQTEKNFDVLAKYNNPFL